MHNWVWVALDMFLKLGDHRSIVATLAALFMVNEKCIPDRQKERAGSVRAAQFHKRQRFDIDFQKYGTKCVLYRFNKGHVF